MDEQLKDQIYNILFQKSKVADIYRVLYEDEWPILELTGWIKEKLEEGRKIAIVDGYLDALVQMKNIVISELAATQASSDNSYERLGRVTVLNKILNEMGNLLDILRKD